MIDGQTGPETASSAGSFSLREFEILRAWLAEGSATGAGLRLGLSQPAISRGLTSLEQRLGRQLLGREGKRLVPLPAALELAAELEVLFTTLDRIAMPDGAARAHEGLLQVAAPPSIAHRLLPEWLAEFAKLHPKLEIRMDCLNGEGLAGAVAEGRFDLALSTSERTSSSVRSEILHESYNVCALPEGHPLADKAVIDVTDLHEVPFIALTRRHSSRHKVDQVFEKAQVRRRITLETATALSALEFVRHGLGVCILNLETLRLSDYEGVVFRPFTPEILTRLHVYLPTRDLPRAAARDLITLIRRRMAETPAQDGAQDGARG